MAELRATYDSAANAAYVYLAPGAEDITDRTPHGE
jgi:hypothetical protein